MENAQAMALRLVHTYCVECTSDGFKACSHVLFTRIVWNAQAMALRLVHTYCVECTSDGFKACSHVLCEQALKPSLVHSTE